MSGVRCVPDRAPAQPPGADMKPGRRGICSTSGLGSGSLDLSVTATGTAPSSFQWFQEGEPIPGGTLDILEIPFLLAADAGTCRMEVSNAFGKTFSTDDIVFSPDLKTWMPVTVVRGSVMDQPVLVAILIAPMPAVGSASGRGWARSAISGKSRIEGRAAPWTGCPGELPSAT